MTIACVSHNRKIKVVITFISYINTLSTQHFNYSDKRSFKFNICFSSLLSVLQNTFQKVELSDA